MVDLVQLHAAVAWQTLHFVYTQPGLYAGAACLLLLEWLLPARPGQRMLRVGLAQDFLWVGVQTVAHVLVLAAWVGVLTAVYQTHLSALTLTGVAALPIALKWPLWVLAIDVLDWTHHWVKHKAPWLWHFHAVHHSQPELNLFTDMRYHPGEYFVSRTLVTFPLLMLQANVAEVLYLSLAHQWYSRFVHASIRTNLGPLRFLLVTPQSHRIHHSIEPAHHDRNFGVIFSLWDRIFGTHWAGANEYPATGIPDRGFPLERSASALAMATTLVRQLLYPFTAIARSLLAHPGTEHASLRARSARAGGESHRGVRLRRAVPDGARGEIPSRPTAARSPARDSPPPPRRARASPRPARRHGTRRPSRARPE